MQTSIFQTDEWANFKCKTGYSDFHRLDGILVLEKKLPLGRTMLYSPEVNKSQISNLKSQNDISKFKSLAQKTKAIFLRLELDVAISDELMEQWNNDLQKLGFRRAFEEMQPEHTLILDISKNESDILEQMKQKGRYNIKIAERSNPKISWSAKPGRELDDFYAMYAEMAKRQKISYRDKKYFEALLEILGQKGYARVYSAYAQVESRKSKACPERSQRVESRDGIQENNLTIKQFNNGHVPLAAAIVTYYNDRATYLFGGSSSEMRNLMAPYGLHWQIIKDARSLACIEYDFFGIAPDDNEKHPWAGVTRFKKQFGGTEIQLAGSWDLVFRPTEYQVFKIAEKIRR